MRIAIIGTGISGLTSAYLLHPHHEITVFESEDRLGGHTATKTVQVGQQRYNIDTGFIVYNDWTYPKFIKLMRRLDVLSQPTSMGFSVFYQDGRFEYSGESLNTLFADRKTLLSLSHWGMIKDILRFNREAVADWKNGVLDDHMTLGRYLGTHGYGNAFCERYLIPMGAAIWSSSCEDMLRFPVRFFIRFFHNHGLLSVDNRPTWRVIRGGSRQYLEPLVKGFKHKIRLAEPVVSVARTGYGVSLRTANSDYQFDQVVFACHSDQALSLLVDPTDDERNVLQAIRYRKNQVILHTDQGFLPKRRRAWAAWNYCLDGEPDRLPILTYNMNILQGLDAEQIMCVTLNALDRIPQEKRLGVYEYAHPIFDSAAMEAQQRWSAINGVNRTWFAGAYWFNGFHEDGVNSALRVSQALGGDTF